MNDCEWCNEYGRCDRCIDNEKRQLAKENRAREADALRIQKQRAELAEWMREQVSAAIWCEEPAGWNIVNRFIERYDAIK